MKKLILIAPLISILASCSSVQNASVADLNGDGIISDAEFKQSGKQNFIQRDNVATESIKRENAVDTLGDVRRSVGNVLGTRNLLRAF